MLPDPVRRLPFIDIAGTPYEVGFALGLFGARAVHRHLTGSSAWHEIARRKGDERVPLMAEAVRERYPRYWSELQGLAAGLGLEFDDVFAWNCRGDIWAMAPDGCTTVQIPGPPHVIGHNEDGDPGFAGECAIARIAAGGGNAFTAFVYPGSLPGHTFAVTSAGLVQTVNNVRPMVGDGKVPRMVVTRAVLDAGNLDGAVACIRTADRAGAFHATLAQRGDRRLLSVEFAAAYLSVCDITAPAIHANHLVHAGSDRISQIVTGSSGRRQRRGIELIASLGGDREAEALRVLWDEADADLPIHRNDPHDPDVENTLASATFHVAADRVDWSVYDAFQKSARFVMGEDLRPVDGAG